MYTGFVPVVHFSCATPWSNLSMNLCFITQWNWSQLQKFDGCHVNLTNVRFPTDILVDFERGAINAIQANFVNANVTGYFFHICSNLWEHVQNIGFQVIYVEDTSATNVDCPNISSTSRCCWRIYSRLLFVKRLGETRCCCRRGASLF